MIVPRISDDLRAKIDGPIERSRGLPNFAYTSLNFFEWEIEHVFANTWTCIGSALSIPTRGAQQPLSWLGAPLVIVRGHDDRIRVFHNVCRHRGNVLVTEACSRSLMQCPYHAWTYALDGSLRRTPQIGGHNIHTDDRIDPDELGLFEVPSAEWMGMVFVNMAGTAVGFDSFIEPLQTRIDGLCDRSELERLQPAADHGALTIEFSGNWKLCVDNNLESYHLPWVHPGLNSVSDIGAHYEFTESDLFAGQGTSDYDHRSITDVAFPTFDGWSGRNAEYPTLFPNVFLGLHCNHFWTRIVEPVAPNRTLDHLQIYYLDDGATDRRYIEGRKAIFDTWEQVFLEDIGVVEGMQNGRHSPAFDGGVFAPERDVPTHYFARWYVKSAGG